MRKKIKITISVLLFIVTLLLFYNGFKKISENVNLIKKTYKSTNMSYLSMCDNINMKKSYKYKEIQLKNEIKDLNMYDMISQEKIIDSLKNNSERFNLDVSKIEFSKVTPYEIDVSDENESELENTEISKDNQNIKKLIGETLSVKFEFYTDLRNLFEFIEELQRENSGVAVTNIHLIPQKDDKIYASIDLNFYAVNLPEGRKIRDEN